MQQDQNNQNNQNSQDRDTAQAVKSSLMTDIGRGACRAVSKAMDASDAYAAYYRTVGRPTMKEYVLNSANSLGRGGAKALAKAVDMAKRVRQSATYGQIKEFMSKGLDSARDGVRDYFAGFEDKISKRAADDLENNDGEFRGSTKFMALAAAVSRKAGSVLSFGMKAAGKAAGYAAERVSEFGRTIKMTDEFKGLSERIAAHSGAEKGRSAYDELKKAAMKNDTGYGGTQAQAGDAEPSMA